MPTKAKTRTNSKNRITDALALDVPSLELRDVDVTLIGDSQLVCHKWSDKAKKMILDKQMKKAKPKKEAKDPEEQYRASLYKHPDGGFGYPAIAFKKASVSAVRNVDGLTMTLARGAYHVIGDLVKIIGKPRPREDMVRIGMGTADIRYRGEFTDWAVTLKIRYNASVLSLEQIVHLFNVAGFGVGVGENRPEKGGNWGMFHVASGEEAARVNGVGAS